MNLPASVRLSDPDGSYPVFEIEHPTCAAKVALHGAHVMSWKPTDEEEVLYLSPDAVFKEGKAIRGGIPVCWPWFNAHPADASQPSHGLVRGRFWELLEASEDDAGVTLRFGVSVGIWNAEVTVKAGEELEVALESKNVSEVPIVVSGALHTYLGVSDISQVRVVKLDGCDYLDTVGEPTVRKQKGDVVFDREVDRIYESSSSVLLVDDLSGRTVLVEKSGSPSTVVWNPWVEKCAALGDMPDDGYQKFCCIEAAIANDRAEIVMPGGSHVLMTRISVEE
ncbi:MAG: D-hexose-6-phosphate mutarotase [Akkermansiaceae bacterium]|jgi:glucose-6-phosphate 1-epimerase|nr:D-hexose-6-phosphate mutarotase [Akkermansiaceae bacterium]MDP4648183.1 D-hexose-6-phosphate mutarotase [Akkermansiaceae bacterium]MDP4721148.1 D-hexose-6-phosphate mutarotase [Akkermansiaceae bacterium]MDP4778888.1 D-hexose-6-phosphate mutarotase [Akkermansiaceae bacterium]MDP4846910.1 D-hexose-6-phosphate mutarotase [Akkermansiaceae bacterium]